MNFNAEIIEAICFDIDGTISDTDDLYVGKLENFLKPFQFLLRNHNLHKLSRRIIMSIESPAHVLMGLPDLIGFDDEIYTLMDFLAKHVQRKPKTYMVVPGVKKMLEELQQDYPLAVVTARDERTTLEFLETTGLDKYFKFSAYAQTCRHTKPFPDPVRWAAEKMGVPVEKCLMVGDTIVDIMAGRSAGSQTIGVLCGFGEKDELVRNGANLILDTTADLTGIFE